MEDDGYPRGLGEGDLQGSIATLHTMAAGLGAAVRLLHTFPVSAALRAAAAAGLGRAARSCRC